jgi:hypothetical protein
MHEVVAVLRTHLRSFFFSSTVIKLTVYFELEKIQKNKFGFVVFLEN